MKNRIVFFLCGIIILTFGVCLIIQAGLGAGAWDALAIGEARVFGLSMGTCVLINGIILIIINSILQKKRPEYLAGLTILTIGLLIDFWFFVLFNHYHPESLPLQVISLICGIIILGLGISIYLQAKLPSSPMDVLMVAIHDRFGLSFGVARVIAEGSAFILALLFRGEIGVGTIVVTLTLGYVVQHLHPYFEKLYHKKMRAHS
ncbi:YczE/YyaS/YitT family protein [Robertmurraya korlensis]|jgi:uncharacterized protein|uniref:YczE/YyaS/YitT family protein n=1 Tax=Robertmurraya korlensis TaxID=519977 RepID=UPI0008241C22|nr:DUF6198 family protein [Robertmurraya korlensis]